MLFKNPPKTQLYTPAQLTIAFAPLDVLITVFPTAKSSTAPTTAPTVCSPPLLPATQTLLCPRSPPPPYP